MSLPHLILGNARYSSWSMRPWLVFKRAGIEFTSEFLPLRTDETRARMAKVSPFALVPTLMLGDEVIGDSWAICEWLAEQVPSLWPRDEFKRAQARMLAGQMHAGFMNIRRELPRESDYATPSAMEVRHSAFNVNELLDGGGRGEV